VTERPASFRIRLNPERVSDVLFGAILLLLVAHVALQVVHFEVTEVPWLVLQLFDVDEEQNLPTWYSGAALLMAAVPTAAHSEAPRRQPARSVNAVARCAPTRADDAHAPAR